MRWWLDQWSLLLLLLLLLLLQKRLLQMWLLCDALGQLLVHALGGCWLLWQWLLRKALWLWLQHAFRGRLRLLHVLRNARCLLLHHAFGEQLWLLPSTLCLLLGLLLGHAFRDQATDSVKVRTEHGLCCQDTVLCKVGLSHVRELIAHCSDLAKGHVKGFTFRNFR